MSRSAQILAAWKAAVFDHATIQAITRKCFDHDVAADIKGMREDAQLRGVADKQINFFTYLASRTQDSKEVRGNQGAVNRHLHRLEVDYYIQKDGSAADQNYNAAINAIEELDDLVRSELGRSWDGTVDYYEFAELRRPTLVDLDGKKAWKVGHTYIGVKTI